ncbi:MAG: glycosyltransferase family 39 protein [Candidatus Hydrogenedentes bacterium]|nr:glycosyltransferase family 39 protein [Candidatus Hydrogenedentota bacterium]
MSYRHIVLIALLAFGALLFAANLGGYELWPADEPRFGQVAREALQDGNWIVLHVNGQPYKEKPPLFFWMIAALSAPFGDVTETTARIPSVLGALTTLLCTFLLAERLYGLRTALLASIVLMTSARFWWQARTAQIDMVLTGCLAIALYAFWMFHESKKRSWLITFYAAIAAAVYAKGPPGIVFPILLIVFFYWGRKAERRQVRLGMGLLFVVVAIALWYIPARLMAAPEVASAVQEGIGANLFRQTIGRFFLGVSKAEPFWFYLVNVPADLFPWTLFLPWTVFAIWQRRKEGDGMRLLLYWTLPALVFFTISAGKRAIYILPLAPAFAILLATTIIQLADRQNLTALRRTIGSVWTLLLLVFAIGIFAAPHYAVSHPDIEIETATLQQIVQSDDWKRIVALAVCALLFGVHALIATIRKQGRAVHFAMAGHVAGLYLVMAVLLFPFINTFKGAAEFCAPLRQLTDAGTEYRFYSVRFSSEAYIFYTKHFQTDFLVDEWPIEPPPGVDALEGLEDTKYLGSILLRAFDNVPVADLAHVTDAEKSALQARRDEAFAFMAGKSKYADHFKMELTRITEEFAAQFETGGPAFMVVQEKDWKWLLSFAPRMCAFPLVGRESVGSRFVLLLANTAGAKLLEAQKHQPPAPSATAMR